MFIYHGDNGKYAKFFFNPNPSNTFIEQWLACLNVNLSEVQELSCCKTLHGILWGTVAARKPISRAWKSFMGTGKSFMGTCIRDLRICYLLLALGSPHCNCKETQQFARKCASHSKFSKWFAPVPVDRAKTRRNKHQKYMPISARTERFKQSPIPHLTEIFIKQAAV